MFTAPTPAALAHLRDDLLGHVLLPDDAGFEEVGAVWNAAVQATPVAIARPASAVEVARCVRFARAYDLPLVVRSGGHSPAGHGTGVGLVLDLSRMKVLEIDPVARQARLEPGLTWGEVADALHPHGLALTSGDSGSVGVGGLTQGGGIGWFARLHGLAIDRLRAVELVTSDGVLLRASATEHPELFWGVRGAGANLGVITALEFDLHEGGTVLGGAVFYDAADAAGILRRFADYALGAPDGLTAQAALMAAPPAPFIPADMVGRPVVAIVLCYSGDLAEGERVVAPLRLLGTPIADLVGPMPYPALFQLTAAGEQRGLRHAVRSQFMTELGDDLVRTLVERTLAVVNPGTMVQLRVLGGAVSRVPRDATAFAHRDRPFLLMVSNAVPVEAGPEAARGAHDATEFVWRAVRPHAAGAYANFLAVGEEGRVTEAFPPVTYARIAGLKARYDRHNVLRRNVNVPPALREMEVALAGSV